MESYGHCFLQVMGVEKRKDAERLNAWLLTLMALQTRLGLPNSPLELHTTEPMAKALLGAHF